MKTRILFIALFLFLIPGVKAQPALKGGMRPFDSMRNQAQPKGKIEVLKRALNLTEDQQETIRKIRVTMAKELLPLKNAAGESRAHLKTLVSAEKPDMAAINQSLDKIGAQKIELAKTAMKYMLQMRSVLTEEQRMKLQMLKKRMKMQKLHGMRNNPMDFYPISIH